MIAFIQYIFNYLSTYLPIWFVQAAGNQAGTPTNNFMSKIVGWVAGVGGAIVAIFIIVALVKDGIEFSKGQGNGSVFKIIGKVLFLIVILGLIFVAVNYTKLGEKAQTVGNGVINTVSNEATGLLNGSGQQTTP